MSKRVVFLLALACCGGPAVWADTIQLKDKYSVTGNVLAEKRDQIVVDLGYTVLVIPRNQIAKILKADSPGAGRAVTARAAEDMEKAVVETEAGFYSASSRPGPASNVRDLVNQIGEAVVQVRTPGGLGSGFIINEDGYLDDQLPRHRGRDADFGGGLSPARRPARAARPTSRCASWRSTSSRTWRC